MRWFLISFSLICTGLLSGAVSQKLHFSPSTKNIYDSDHAYEYPDGSSLKFSSFKRKLLLIHVWAYWCVATEGRPKELDELMRKVDHPDFDIIHVSMDTSRVEWRKYIEENN